MSKKTKSSPKQPNYDQLALSFHKKHHGKIELKNKGQLKSRTDWSTLYTPGVAAVSKVVASDPKAAREYTVKRNSVAVVSDGSAVLGLGNIGALGALPVMEGKCAIFKAKADIDAWPIVLDTQDPDEVVETVKRIAPGFGGINLEDFAAPNCFVIEERLKKELDIPVMHDDQHGTAIVVLAGLINAAKVVKKNVKEMRVVIVGAGAAGHAIALLLIEYGLTHIVTVDSKGIIHRGRKGLSGYKHQHAKVTNPHNLKGQLEHAVEGADVLIGVSGPGIIEPHHVEVMAKDAIVFALANPTPEITPDVAKKAGAAVVATGRSDYPNQVNNSLAFPGIFRGALDKGVKHITEEMKLKAAKALAALVKKPTVNKIIPGVMEAGVMKAVAKAVK